MTTRELLRQIADLILVSDEDTAGWIEVPALRRTYYFLCAALCLFLLHVLLNNPLGRVAVRSESVTLSYRIGGLCISMLLGLLVLLLTAQYFKYVLSQHGRIYLMTVSVLYAFSVVSFGLIYFSLWLLWPSLFDYLEPPVRHSTLGIADPWGISHLRLEFMLFSALQTVNGSFYKIHSNGIIPSLIGWVQSIYTLCLVALLIASYVNQNVGRRRA